MTVQHEPKKKNGTEDTSPMIRIDPPSKTERHLKNPTKLIREIIYLLVISLPLILWSLVNNILFKTPKSVNGKVVLVTGSGRGLGRGFVEKFLELGCKVACVDIDEKLNQETVKELNERYPACVKAYTCNVAISSQIRTVKQAVNKDFGHVDILIHNAAIVASTSITDFEDIYVHGVISVNLISHFYMIREFLPDMLKRNKGHLVAVGSVASFVATSKTSMYTATKHGILGLMETLHCELEEIKQNRVKTSIICPYFVNTNDFYIKYWDLRIPELSIKQTVEAAVEGILKNKRIIMVPGYFYPIVIFFKLLPDKLLQILREIFYVRITIPSLTVQKRIPLFKLLMDTRHEMIELMN